MTAESLLTMPLRPVAQVSVCGGWFIAYMRVISALRLVLVAVELQ